MHLKPWVFQTFPEALLNQSHDAHDALGVSMKSQEHVFIATISATEKKNFTKNPDSFQKKNFHLLWKRTS